MNKKVNTLLFILGGTLFNVIIAVAAIILLYILFTVICNRIFPGVSQEWCFPASFIAGIVLSFFACRVMLKFVTKKVDLEKYLDPLFVRTNIKRNRSE